MKRREYFFVAKKKKNWLFFFQQFVSSLAASENLGCWLAALWGIDFAGSVFARRRLTKLISDRLLRQRTGLMIYNKIERVLVITKQIFNYYNTNFLLEITSKVQKVNQKFMPPKAAFFSFRMQPLSLRITVAPFWRLATERKMRMLFCISRNTRIRILRVFMLWFERK